jgi:MraZ protein
MAMDDGQVMQRTADAATKPRFTGRFAGKVDTKGRIVIPNDFRRELPGQEVHCFVSLIEPALQCGPASLLDDLLKMTSGLDVYDEERWALEEEITAGIMRLSIDETGRVSLPKAMREDAALDGGIGFVGRGRHFVVAGESHLAARRDAARRAASHHRDTLRARMLPSVSGGRGEG